MTPTPEPPPRDDKAELGGRSVRLGPGVTMPGAALRFSAARASGPGGQNVNRRATKVELRVFLDALPLTDAVRHRLRRLAGSRVTSEGELLIVSQVGRTQLENRHRCLAELRELIAAARRPPKVRKKTRPSRGSVERRLEAKKQRGQRKRERGRRFGDGDR
jgi:ribosome-associated protein